MTPDELFSDVGPQDPPALTAADPVKVKWRHGDSQRATRVLLERFLQHESVLQQHKPFRRGDRLQTRALDTRMITRGWVGKDALLTEKGAQILNAAAREGYWRVVSRAREQGTRATIEWLLEGGDG